MNSLPQVFGLAGSPALSHTTLHLQPQAAFGSNQNLRPTVRPLYRKDVFYSGSASHLAHAEQQHQNQHQSQHPRDGFNSSLQKAQLERLLSSLGAIEGFTHPCEEAW